MHGNNQFHNPSSYILTFRAEGVTSAALAKVHKVPRGSTIKIYPTVEPAEAAVYSSNSPSSITDAYETIADVEPDDSTVWDIWGAGAVTAKTVQQANVPLEVVVLAVTEGTWVLEVTGT